MLSLRKDVDFILFIYSFFFFFAIIIIISFNVTVM